MTLETLLKQTGHTLKEHSPTILTAMGAAGVITTGYLAGRAGYQTADMVWVEASLSDFEAAESTAKDKIRIGWKFYIPAMLTGAATVACVIAAHSVSHRRNVALMSAVTLGETAFREYRDKMVEVAGKAKDHKAVEELAQKKLERSDSEVVFVGNDKVLCFDVLTGRYFESTKLEIEKAEVETNRQINNDMYASQNEWYDRIGLGRVSGGDDIGWNGDIPLEVKFLALLKDDKPVLGVDYRFRPVPDFYKLR